MEYYLGTYKKSYKATTKKKSKMWEDTNIHYRFLTLAWTKITLYILMFSQLPTYII